MIILLELMMQQLAAATGQDPDDFRAQHMLTLPQDALDTAAAAAQEAGEDEHELEADTTSAAATPSAAANGTDQQQQHQGQAHQQVPHPKFLPKTSSGSDGTNSSSNGSNDGSSNGSSSAPSVAMKTTLGQPISVDQYTLPYMLQQLRASSSYAARRAAVEEFNRTHSSRKRGLALVPVRWVGAGCVSFLLHQGCALFRHILGMLSLPRLELQSNILVESQDHEVGGSRLCNVFLAPFGCSVWQCLNCCGALGGATSMQDMRRQLPAAASQFSTSYWAHHQG
jgi:hypothetical protein